MYCCQCGFEIVFNEPSIDFYLNTKIILLHKSCIRGYIEKWGQILSEDFIKRLERDIPMENTILEEAQKAVYGDRQSDYGTVTENFGTIAALWTATLGKKLREGERVTPELVGLCMVQIKVARQMYKPKRDNLVDGAGYFATIEKMENENK